jgi:hypothetical protein
MCQSRNSTKVKLKNGKIVRVDMCIAPLIEQLNDHGIKTLSCCCGHDRYEPTVIVVDKITKKPMLYSDSKMNLIINRKKRFYVKDAEGYYFIPETMKKLNDAVPCELKRNC